MTDADVTSENCPDTDEDELDDPATVFTPDDDGDNSSHLAIIRKDCSGAIEIIGKAESHIWLSYQNYLRQAPIHLAALTNQVSVVRTLIESGADIIALDRNGNIPLMLACRDGFIEVAECILECICSIDIQNDITTLLSVKNFEGLTCIHIAANKGNIEIVKLLLEHGADCNAKEGKSGRTILHNACLSESTELVIMLTKCRSCNINAKAFDGLTPFDLVRSRSEDTICMVLATAGYIINLQHERQCERSLVNLGALQNHICLKRRLTVTFYNELKWKQ